MHERKRADAAADEEWDVEPARIALDGDGPDVPTKDRTEAARERDNTLSDTVREADERRWRHVVEQNGYGCVSERCTGVPDGRAERESGHEDKVPIILGRGEYAVERDGDVARDEEDGAQAKHGEMRKAAARWAEIWIKIELICDLEQTH